MNAIKEVLKIRPLHSPKKLKEQLMEQMYDKSRNCILCKSEKVLIAIRQKYKRVLYTSQK